MTKLITWLTGILTLTLAVFSFVLSFNALSALAEAHGVSIPPLFPFVVEFAVVIFSFNVLFRSLTGQGARWQWALIIGSSLLAGAFNIAHAEPDPLSRFMAAMPSLFLLLSFESFMSLVGYTVRHSEATQTLETLKQGIEHMSEVKRVTEGQITSTEAKLKALQGELKSLRKEKRKYNWEVSTETVEQARVILSERPDISGAELGRQLGRSDSLGRRLKKSLNGQGAK